MIMAEAFGWALGGALDEEYAYQIRPGVLLRIILQQGHLLFYQPSILAASTHAYANAGPFRFMLFILSQTPGHAESRVVERRDN
jgi:hypothetical protein